MKVPLVHSQFDFNKSSIDDKNSKITAEKSRLTKLILNTNSI